MSLTRDEIDRAIGTPCLCGNIETWRPACYAGKTNSETQAGYDRAYRIVNRHLVERAQRQAAQMLVLSSKRHKGK